MFFSPDPTPFPGPGELCSDHFSKNKSFTKYSFYSIFPFNFRLLCSISTALNKNIRGGGIRDE